MLILTPIFLFCLVLGAAIPVFPMGLMLRFVIVLMAVLALALAWRLRTPGESSLSQPVIGLLLLAVALSILWPRFIYFPLAGVYVNPQSLSSLAAIFVCLLVLASNSGICRSVANNWAGLKVVALLIGLFLAWRVLASLLGDYPVQSTLSSVRDIVYTAGFIVVAAVILAQPGADRWLLRLIVLCGLLAVVYGLLEAFLQKNPLLKFASGADTDEVAGALKALAMDKFRAGRYRAQAVFSHPIVFSQAVAALIPLGLLLALTERNSRLWRVVGVLLIPIGLLAILKSGSRSGLVSVLGSVGFCMFVFWARGLRSQGLGRIAALLGVPVLLTALVVLGYLGRDLVLGRSIEEMGSTSARVEMVARGVKALAERPITGFGDGMSLSVAGLSSSSGIASVDSYLLSIAVDSGYVGLLLFLALIVAFSWRAVSAVVASRGDSGLEAGLIGASVVALVASFVGLSITHNMTLFWILLVLGCYKIHQVDVERVQVRRVVVLGAAA